MSIMVCPLGSFFHSTCRSMSTARMTVPTNDDEDSELLIDPTIINSTCRRVPWPFRQLQIVLVLMAASVFMMLSLTNSNLLRPSLGRQQELHLDQVAPVAISNDAWQELMQVIQANLNDPKVRGDMWLPIILQGRSIYLRKEHVNGFKGLARFDNLIGVLEYALAYGMVKTNTPTTPTTGTSLQLQNNNTHISRREDLPIFANHTSIPLVFFLADARIFYNTLFPRFTWCTLWENETHCPVFPIPTYTLFQAQPDQTPDQHVFHATLKQKYPWSTKLRQAVWRGAATGYAPNGWASLPRAQFVNYSLRYPDLFDAAFVDSAQFHSLYPEEHFKLRNFSRFADRIEMNDYQKYRAVVDIDGNSWSTRFGQLLCMNTVVIKVRVCFYPTFDTAVRFLFCAADSTVGFLYLISVLQVYPRNKNYFFDQLQPWQHYIPVKNDLSDLIDAARFADSDKNKRKVQQIIYRANEFCRTTLTRRRMGEDTYWMIQQYIQLLGDNATRWRQWEDLYQGCQQNFTLVPATQYNPVPEQIYHE